MNLNEVLAQARQNQRTTSASQKNQYSTKVQPPKKLPKNQVNKKAIQAFLNRQREDQRKRDIEAEKKKAGLLKLRDASKNTKKANSMAKRTKDNLKVYKGEDILGLYPEPKKRRMTDLTPEEDRRHKAFMKNIDKVKVPGIDDDDSDANEPLTEREERKRRKMEKLRAKSRSASNLEFGDLLKLAEVQKTRVSDSSSDESESEVESDGDVDRYGRPLSVEEKYYREKRKNRELEERLKMTGKKTPSNSRDRDSKSSKSLANFKIGKLNPAMSDDAKRAKVKALMESFNKSAQNTQSQKPKSSFKSAKVPPKSTSNMKSHESSSKKLKRKHESSKKPNVRPYTPAKKPRAVPPASSIDQTISSYLKKQETMTSSSMKKNKPTPQKPSEVQVQKAKTEHVSVKKPSSSINVNSGVKKPVNPYKHTVVKAKGVDPAKRLIDPWAKEKAKRIPEDLPSRKGKCTLSVTSEEVRTNYPGVAKEDPYIQAYKQTGKVIQNFTPETIARYKARMIRKLREQGRPIPPAMLAHAKPVQKQRYGVLNDNSDDEYDPELEDFIADDVEEEEIDVSSHIKQIFGYDKSKYGRESEWELSKMDASYKDIEKEEKRSLRIARQEDAREAKLEEERMKRKANRKR